MRLDLNCLSISLVGCLEEEEAEWELSFFLIVSMYELIEMSSVLFSLWRSGFILIRSSPIGALMFFVESGTVIWKVKGSFCYGLSKVLATPVTWHSKEIFAEFRNARCSLCQPKLLPGVFTTKWAAQSSVSAIEIPWDSSEVSVLSSLSFSM